jgi:hypothetical protein
MARAGRGCKRFLVNRPRVVPDWRPCGAWQGRGLAFGGDRRYIRLRCRLGRSFGRCGGIIELPTPAMENRVAPVLFMLTMAVDYL